MRKRGKKLTAYQREYDRIKRQVREAKKNERVNEKAKLLDNIHSSKLNDALKIMETLGRTPDRVTAKDINTLQRVSSLTVKSSYGWEREHKVFKYDEKGNKEYTGEVRTVVTTLRKAEEEKRRYIGKLNYERKKFKAGLSGKDVKDFDNKEHDYAQEDVDELFSIIGIKATDGRGIKKPVPDDDGVLPYQDILIHNYIYDTLGQIKESRSNVEWSEWTNDLMDYVKKICEELVKVPNGRKWLAEQIEEMNVPVIIWGDSLEWTTKVAKLFYFLENAEDLDFVEGSTAKTVFEYRKKIEAYIEEQSYQRDMGTERGDYD